MVRFLFGGLVALIALALVWVSHASNHPGEKAFKVEGKLTKDDPKDKYLKESPHKIHDFKMKKDAIYVIDMNSKDFDTFLRLEDPTGKMVAYNDNIDFKKKLLDSRIIYKAAADGTYKIIATTYDGTAGTYTLSVRPGTVAEWSAADPAPALIGKPAPDITSAFTLNGKTKKLSDLKGKVVLLDFWAVWCGPCIATFPHLREWCKDYQKDGLEIVGVTTYYKKAGFDKETGKLKQVAPQSADEEHEMLKNFAAHHKLTYQLLTLTNDNYEKAESAYGIDGIPHAVLIDRQGNVRMYRVGSSPDNAEALQNEIRKLLKEK